MYPQSSSGQNQLPYSAEQFTAQPMNLSLNNPPWVPQVPLLDPGMANMLPYISAAVALEIQNNMQKNPLRVFAFNLFGRNNYQNDEFSKLVAGVADTAVIACTKRIYGSLEQAVPAIVIQLVEHSTCVQVQLYPSLEYYVQPNDKPYVTDQINKFNAVAGELQSWRQRSQTPNSSYYGNTQQGYSPNAGYSGGGGGSYGDGSSLRGMTGGQGHQPMVYNTRPFGNPAVVGRQMDTGRVFGNAGPPVVQQPTHQPFQFQQPVQTTKTQETQVNNQVTTPFATQTAEITEVEEIVAYGNEGMWTPSDRFPYFSATQRSTHYATMAFLPNSVVKPRVFSRKDMEYDRHATGGGFGPIPSQLKLAPAAEIQEKLFKTVEQIVSQKDASLGENLSNLVVTESTGTVSCENEAWLTVEMHRLCADTDDKTPFIFRAYMRINDFVLNEADDSSALVNFANSGTYAELHRRMDSSANIVGRELWALVNRRMTRKVNEVLQQNLGLAKMVIDDFYGDIETLIPYLNEKYGKIVHDGFLAKQESDIRSVLQSPHEDAVQAMWDNYFAGYEFAEGAPKPVLSGIASDVSLTLLDCNAHELDIALLPKGGTAIIPSLMPNLHAMLAELFEDAETKRVHFDRHLIKTNDGHILQATRGYLSKQEDGKCFYLLSVVR